MNKDNNNYECTVVCDINKWCMCESIQFMERKIESDIEDLSIKEKERYLDQLYTVLIKLIKSVDGRHYKKFK